MKKSFVEIRKYLKRLLYLLLVVFGITLLLCFWKAEIMYISFYILIWGIMPISLFLLADFIARRYNFIK